MDGKKLLILAAVGLFVGVAGFGAATSVAGPAPAAESVQVSATSMSSPDLGLMCVPPPGQTNCGPW